MKASKKAVAALAVAAGLLAASPGTANAASGLAGIALYGDGTRLARFTTSNPGNAKIIGIVDDLVGDTKLVGIDRRVQNRRLYGVGDQGGIYVLSAASANTRKVGQLSIALDGTNFGVDFNPAANALRIVSNTGQNLRQPFGTSDGPTGPTVADGTLTYPATPTTPATTARGVTAAAYTNNDLSADTGTTLFDIDTLLNQVVIQSPANSGSLVTTGKLGVNAGANAGFDIYSDLKSGKTASVEAFAVLNSRLYSIDLLTGDADRVGTFNKNGTTDIALSLD